MMIPPTDRTDSQMEVLSKIRSVQVEKSDLTDRLVLKSLFENYRSGSGMRLSKFGKELCIEHELYAFAKFNIPKGTKKSVLFITLDRLCKEPYYVEGFDVFLSDAQVITELTFCCDDFEKLIKLYL